MASKYQIETLLNAHVGRSYMSDEKCKEAFFGLYEDDGALMVAARNVRDGKVVYPPQNLIGRAFSSCPLTQLRVVVLGQDPYHDGRATGLCFDNAKDLKPSPSLKAILAEIESDTGRPSVGIEQEQDSYLAHLPSQGVLLLNSALTVIKGKPGSHSKFWKPFTTKIVKAICARDEVVWLLWGNHAKSYKRFIDNKTHVIIEGKHPSPLAGGGFKGGKYFTKTNQALESFGYSPIAW
jgi:uracil-DNA glycosylase